MFAGLNEGFGCLKLSEEADLGNGEQQRGAGMKVAMGSKGQRKQDFCRSLSLSSDYKRNVHTIERCPRN